MGKENESDGEQDKLLLKSLYPDGDDEPFFVEPPHIAPIGEVLAKYGTDRETGLLKSRCKDLRKIFGSNIIPSPVTIPSWLCCLLPCLSYSKTLAKFNDCIPDHSEVMRESRWILLDCASIVPGDLVRIGANDRVPADIRIIEVVDKKPCKFDTWAVSGEDTLKTCAADKSSKSYLASENMIFAGYLCTEGCCIGVVLATGPRTELGRLVSKKKWPIGR